MVQVYGNVHFHNSGFARVTVTGCNNGTLTKATVGHPMARGATGGIPGNGLGQCSTRPSTFTHVLGVSGAPTGAVGGAADGTQWVVLSATIAKNRVGNAHAGPKRRRSVEMNVL